ncbi:MAG: hypothetical protein IPN17_27335 [Deltaproteobacteria bacterium]|nr:hypothetical protein [Deltaproteobacteria bacterium]
MRPDGMERAEALTSTGCAPKAPRPRGRHRRRLLHLPSHSSMLSGVEVRAHWMTFDDFHADRGFIFSLRPLALLPPRKTVGFSTADVGSAKLQHIVPGSVDVWSRPHRSCERAAAAAAAEYLATATPGSPFIHFSEPDDSGHRFGWMQSATFRPSSPPEATGASPR